MFRSVLICLLFIIDFSIVSAQTEVEVIRKANELIASKKYETAFRELDKFDPKNSKPDIVLLKEDIVLNYFVSSMMHQIFALKDLVGDETVYDYRGNEGSFSMFPFAANLILDSLIKIYPENCNLYRGLGNFYFEVSEKYSAEWMKDEDELKRLIELNNNKAIEGKCADYITYYESGQIALLQKKYKESIPLFLKSLELNTKDNINSYYNLAYAYMYTEERENAIKYAKLSYDKYTDSSYKADAARMMGQVYLEMKDDSNATVSYELADKNDTGKYENIKPLLNVYVKTGNEKWKKTLRKFYDLGPDNPTIYNDLEDIFYQNDKVSDLKSFYEEELKTAQDLKSVGSLHFYLAKIYSSTDKQIAKGHFVKAKEVLSKVYSEDNKVFKIIDKAIEDL